MAGTAQAQVGTDSGGPTYSGTVVGATDSDSDGVNDTSESTWMAMAMVWPTKP